MSLDRLAQVEAECSATQGLASRVAALRFEEIARGVSKSYFADGRSWRLLSSLIPHVHAVTSTLSILRGLERALASEGVVESNGSLLSDALAALRAVRPHLLASSPTDLSGVLTAALALGDGRLSSSATMDAWLAEVLPLFEEIARRHKNARHTFAVITADACLVPLLRLAADSDSSSCCVARATLRAALFDGALIGEYRNVVMAAEKTSDSHASFTKRLFEALAQVPLADLHPQALPFLLMEYATAATAHKEHAAVPFAFFRKLCALVVDASPVHTTTLVQQLANIHIGQSAELAARDRWLTHWCTTLVARLDVQASLDGLCTCLDVLPTCLETHIASLWHHIVRTADANGTNEDHPRHEQSPDYSALVQRLFDVYGRLRRVDTLIASLVASLRNLTATALPQACLIAATTAVGSMPHAQTPSVWTLLATEMSNVYAPRLEQLEGTHEPSAKRAKKKSKKKKHDDDDSDDECARGTDDAHSGWYAFLSLTAAIVDATPIPENYASHTTTLNETMSTELIAPSLKTSLAWTTIATATATSAKMGLVMGLARCATALLHHMHLCALLGTPVADAAVKTLTRRVSKFVGTFAPLRTPPAALRPLLFDLALALHRLRTVDTSDSDGGETVALLKSVIAHWLDSGCTPALSDDEVVAWLTLFRTHTTPLLGLLSDTQVEHTARLLVSRDSAANVRVFLCGTAAHDDARLTATLARVALEKQQRKSTNKGLVLGRLPLCPDRTVATACVEAGLDGEVDAAVLAQWTHATPHVVTPVVLADGGKRLMHLVGRESSSHDGGALTVLGESLVYWVRCDGGAGVDSGVEEVLSGIGERLDTVRQKTKSGGDEDNLWSVAERCASALAGCKRPVALKFFDRARQACRVHMGEAVATTSAPHAAVLRTAAALCRGEGARSAFVCEAETQLHHLVRLAMRSSCSEGGSDNDGPGSFVWGGLVALALGLASNVSVVGNESARALFVALVLHTFQCASMEGARGDASRLIVCVALGRQHRPDCAAVVESLCAEMGLEHGTERARAATEALAVLVMARGCGGTVVRRVVLRRLFGRLVLQLALLVRRGGGRVAVAALRLARALAMLDGLALSSRDVSLLMEVATSAAVSDNGDAETTGDVTVALCELLSTLIGLHASAAGSCVAAITSTLSAALDSAARASTLSSTFSTSSPLSSSSCGASWSRAVEAIVLHVGGGAASGAQSLHAWTRHASHIIAAYATLLQARQTTAQFRRDCADGLYVLLDLAGERGIEFLSSSLVGQSLTSFQHLYTDYKRFHEYKGKF